MLTNEQLNDRPHDIQVTYRKWACSSVKQILPWDLRQRLQIYTYFEASLMFNKF